MSSYLDNLCRVRVKLEIGCYTKSIDSANEWPTLIVGPEHYWQLYLGASTRNTIHCPIIIF